MEQNIILNNLSDPKEVLRLKQYLQDLYREEYPIYTTTNPNGNIEAKRGRMALYYDASDYFIYMNLDGSTTWKGVKLTET